MTGRVVVVGSMNRDYVCRVSSLPRPGETLLGGELSLGAGGKGGNQAAAASRMQVPCLMVGCVGRDADGDALREALAAHGADTSHVLIDDDAPTGAAFVFVDGAGENSIVVAPGANSKLDAATVRSVLVDLLDAGDVLVVQAEIPLDAIVAASAVAAATGARLVLNLAPYAAMSDEVLNACDPLVVNESEARSLLGAATDAELSGRELAVQLSERSRSAVVTVGGSGAVVASDGGVEHVAAEAVAVVDSTGAGDAFTGVLAARLAGGADLVDAVRLGVAAGTYSVQRPGAQASYPMLSDLVP